MLQRLAVAALLLVLFLLNVLSVRRKSVTFDEPRHVRYGLQILEGDSRRFDDSKMPFTALNMLPYRAAALVPSGSLHAWLFEPRNGRLVTILFSLGLAWIVYRWASALYGGPAGLLALVLYVFSPNLLGHARWITTDLYAAFTFTWALYAYWRFSRRPGPFRAMLAGALLGLALLAKFTAVLLGPIFVLLAVVRFGPSVVSSFWRRDVGRAGRAMGRGLGWAGLMLVASLLVLNAGFFFRGTGKPLEDYTLKSAFFCDLQSRLGFLNRVPLPLPEPFVGGIDWTKFNEESGCGRGPSYLLGELRRGRFSWYFVVVFLYKIPLAIHGLLLLAAVHYVVRRRRYRFRHDEAFLVVPGAVLAVFLVFLCQAQLGIRHALMILPLAHVFVSSVLRGFPGASRRLGAVVGALVVYLVVSTLSWYPHFLSYFNELVWHRGRAYQILADSNLDWGQNDWYAHRYCKKHPGTHLNPTAPICGRVLISANRYLGISRPEEYSSWSRVRGRIQPVDHVACSYLVFEITPEFLLSVIEEEKAAKQTGKTRER